MRKGKGLALTLYRNSLSIAFFLLFFLSFALHLIGGAHEHSQEQEAHGGSPVTAAEFLRTSDFWFQSLQNWQSEFLAVAAIVFLSISLRQQGSPESKPVAAPHVGRDRTRRFDRLASACDHDTMFALSYLRTTEEYKRAALEPGFFEDTGFVNHEDAVFARYYFDAYDAWHRGDVAKTPKAWRVALEAADGKAVDGGTNVLLGTSAHINRDLPFVLWEIGLVKAEGTSRKVDHDRVNAFLNRVVLHPEIHARFDDSVSPDQPAGAIHAIIAMRENAWRNAKRLRAAERDPLLFAAVKKSIEDAAHLEALAIRDSGRYGWGESSAARDAYCAAQRDA